MKGFTVIDNKTGNYPDCEEIALNEDWAKHLCYCDIDNFAITEDGSLILLDECGKCAYCPEGRFTIVTDNNVGDKQIEELESSRDVTDTNVGKWISVKERLPEYEEPVMGWDAEMRDMGIVNFIYGKFFDILDMSETNVTHWQYLPQPPKGE